MVLENIRDYGLDDEDGGEERIDELIEQIYEELDLPR